MKPVISKQDKAAAAKERAQATVWDPYLEGKIRLQKLKSAEGGSLDSKTAASRLGVTNRALRQRARRRQVVAWVDSGKHYHYPAWQFIEAGVLPGVMDCPKCCAIPISGRSCGSFSAKLNPQEMSARSRCLEKGRSVVRLKSPAPSPFMREVTLNLPATVSGRECSVEMVGRFQRKLHAPPAGLGKRSELASAHFDQGELGGYEEPVSHNQHEDDDGLKCDAEEGCHE